LKFLTFALCALAFDKGSEQQIWMLADQFSRQSSEDFGFWYKTGEWLCLYVEAAADRRTGPSCISRRYASEKPIKSNARLLTGKTAIS
jgi:hypothetical protein